MTSDKPPTTPDDSLESESEFDRATFERELAELLAHAREAGVPLECGYDVRTPWPDQPDYTVEITELAPRTSPPRS